MAINRARYVEEIYNVEGNISKIFSNVDYIYKNFKALFVRTEDGFEIGSGTVFVRIEEGWINLETGEIINN